MEMMLRAGDVTLRPLTLRDLDDVVDACRDGEIVRFALLVPSPYTAEDGRRFLKQVESEWAQERADRVFAIVADGAFQGVISVNLGTGVVGYWMRREGRGRGWMTEALKLIVDWAESGGAVRPWLTTHPDKSRLNVWRRRPAFNGSASSTSRVASATARWLRFVLSYVRSRARRFASGGCVVKSAARPSSANGFTV